MGGCRPDSQSGTTTLYVNGVAKATSAATPNVPAGNFAIGTTPQVPGAQTFNGLVDEARVFTFVAGQFSTTDLFINTPVSLSTYQLFEPAAATNDGFIVRASVSWLTVLGGSWLHLNGTGSGSGNLVQTFTCDANPGPTRRGTIQVASQLLTIIQAGSGYVTATVPKRTLISGFPTQPNDVVLDAAGNAYYIDFGRKSLRVWSAASQTVSTLFRRCKARREWASIPPGIFTLATMYRACRSGRRPLAHSRRWSAAVNRPVWR